MAHLKKLITKFERLIKFDILEILLQSISNFRLGCNLKRGENVI